jgi:hypothetical protein
MALSVVFIVLLFAWAFLVFAFYVKEPYLVMLASILNIVWGVYVVLYGFDGVQDWFTEALAMVNAMGNCYIFVRAGWEEYKQL